MDLSKNAKTRRDAVEDPLFLVEKLLEELEECHTRIDATIKVYPETSGSLKPALSRQVAIEKGLTALQEKLSHLWRRGAAKLWKEL